MGICHVLFILYLCTHFWFEFPMETKESYIVDLNALEQGTCVLQYGLTDTFFRREELAELLGGECSAKVEIARVGDAFSVRLSVKGKVSVVCDRCLEAVAIPMDCAETLTVKLEAGEDEGDIVRVNPLEGKLDLAWLLYELVVINLPTVHSHQPGECNPQMEELLQSHLCTLAEEDNTEMVADAQPE